MQLQKLGFTFDSVFRGETHQSIARFTCTECGETLDIYLRRGFSPNPTHVAKLAISRGWRASATNPKKTRCLTCATPPKKWVSLNAVSEAGRQAIAADYAAASQAAETITVPGADEPIRVLAVDDSLPSAESLDESEPEPEIDTSETIEEEQVMPYVPKPPAKPTVDQRVKIRSMLDKHFDDADGMYLDGMSDQAIADSVDLPRIIVSRMRDAAYGPIRTNPEYAALRNDLNAAKADLERVQAVVDAGRAKIYALESRLNELLKANA